MFVTKCISVYTIITTLKKMCHITFQKNMYAFLLTLMTNSNSVPCLIDTSNESGPNSFAIVNIPRQSNMRLLITFN